MKIGIVGAGVAGLSAAWEAVNAGHEVHVFEAGDLPGGLAAGFKDEHWDWWMEKFYHHWFTTDNHLLRLADELGVRNRVIFPRPKTSYWIDGELYQSEMNASIFGLPLSPVDIFRMGASGAFLKFAVRNGKWMEQYTAHEWLQLYMGKAAYEMFFKPLLIGKFGDDYQDVNMAWLWARIFTRSVKLGTYEGGFQTFMNDFAGTLQDFGAQIHLNTPVEHIGVDGDGDTTLQVGGQVTAFDRVISTTSPQLLLKLTPRLQSTAYGDKVNDLESIGAVVVIAALKNQLLEDNTYWLNLPAPTTDSTQNPFPFLALVEHTNFLPPENFNGDRLVYMGDYVPPEHEYFQMSEDALAQRFTAELPKFNPRYQDTWLRKTWVFRAPYAQPVPRVYHSEKIPDLETPVPGLYWASMSQVYPYDRGTNFAVEIGRRVARLALGED
ncbi:MAG: NAD(P)/FAD-dependent oxidoreductase [Chloroflexota bacterium]